MAGEVKNKLTPRQWHLVTLLSLCAERDPNRWLTQEEIIESYSIAEHKDGYYSNESLKAHDKCSAIWNDINAIQFSGDTRKIIIQKDFKYKIASEEEALDYISFYEKKAKIASKRMSQLKRKFKKHNQGTLFDNRANPIKDGSSAKTFIQAFVDRKVLKQDLINNNQGE